MQNQRIVLLRGICGMAMGLAMVLMLAACGSKQSTQGDFPANFDSMSVTEKMDYVMANSTPEEVARFICDAALENNGVAFIDPKESRVYAYEHYNEDQTGLFEQEIEKYTAGLPMAERMKFAALGGLVDMDAFCLEQGLTYVNDIREKKKNITQIEDELYALRQVCADNPEYYREFMKGYKEALELYQENIDRNIYLHFISYPDTIQ